MNSSSVTDQTSHRPWPIPQTRWILFMRWHDLLFLHWPIRPELIRPLIPEVVQLDLFDGWCWLGVVPFHMSGVHPRYLPVPMAFPELNVRTYVKTANRSGVWFFSLDAANWLAVRAARWLGMPYYDARMKMESKEDWIQYTSARDHKGAAPAEFTASYRPTGPVYYAAPSTLDHWLTERYCLFSALKPKRVVYGEIHHLSGRCSQRRWKCAAMGWRKPRELLYPRINRSAILPDTRKWLPGRLCRWSMRTFESSTRHPEPTINNRKRRKSRQAKQPVEQRSF